MCIPSYWFFYFYLASARLLVQFQSETQFPFGLHQKAIYLLEGASSLVLLLRFRSFSIKIQCGSIKYTLGVAATSGQLSAAQMWLHLHLYKTFAVFDLFKSPQTSAAASGHYFDVNDAYSDRIK